METISRQLLETILRLNNTSSKDETRLHLNGVHVFKRDNRTYIESTDGHKMTRELLSDSSTVINDETDLILCRKDISKIKKFLRTYNGKKDFDCELNDSSLVIRVGTSDLISIYLIKRDYPRIDSVIPGKLKESDKAVSITFNPGYLMEIYESLKTRKGQLSVTLTFDVTNSLSPILVEVESNDNQIGVLMPCRSDKGQASSERMSKRFKIGERV